MKFLIRFFLIFEKIPKIFVSEIELSKPNIYVLITFIKPTDNNFPTRLRELN